MRVRHDLLGCANRLFQSQSELHEMVEKTRELWKDQRAERFMREDLSSIGPTIDRLVAALREAAEQIQRMDRRLKDDDAN